MCLFHRGTHNLKISNFTIEILRKKKHSRSITIDDKFNHLSPILPVRKTAINIKTRSNRISIGIVFRLQLFTIAHR